MSENKGRIVTTEFNENQKITHYTTTLGYEVWFEYDETGKLKERRDNEGNIDKYLYDENGDLIPFEKYML